MDKATTNMDKDMLKTENVICNARENNNILKEILEELGYITVRIQSLTDTDALEALNKLKEIQEDYPQSILPLSHIIQNNVDLSRVIQYNVTRLRDYLNQYF